KPETAGHVATDTTARLNAWIQKYLMPTGGYSKGNLAFHSLWIADRPAPPLPPKFKPRRVPAAVDADAEQLDSPLGGWGGPVLRRMIPPLSQQYANHIVYAR